MKNTLIYLLYVILVGIVASMITPVVLVLVGLGLMAGTINAAFLVGIPSVGLVVIVASALLLKWLFQKVFDFNIQLAKAAALTVAAVVLGIFIMLRRMGG